MRVWGETQVEKEKRHFDGPMGEHVEEFFNDEPLYHSQDIPKDERKDGVMIKPLKCCRFGMESVQKYAYVD